MLHQNETSTKILDISFQICHFQFTEILIFFFLSLDGPNVSPSAQTIPQISTGKHFGPSRFNGVQERSYSHILYRPIFSGTERNIAYLPCALHIVMDHAFQWLSCLWPRCDVAFLPDPHVLLSDLWALSQCVRPLPRQELCPVPQTSLCMHKVK